MGAAWGSGPAAPGVGRITEGGAEGQLERGVTTSKAGRRRRTVGGAGGCRVSATSASSSVVTREKNFFFCLSHVFICFG